MHQSAARSRSTTSVSIPSNNRPGSRASTTSYHSSNTQISPQDGEYEHPSHIGVPQIQALEEHHHTGHIDFSQHYAAASLSNYDPALAFANHSEQHISDHFSVSTHDEDAIRRQLQSRGNRFVIEGEQRPLSGTSTHAQSGETEQKKSAARTATNDKELREMLVTNNGRSLRSVAQEVIASERTPRAERTKQLFAMLWLKAVCKRDKTSVPRNRVYAHYAMRCGTERVVPLNSASFGKLVRVIFPGIQTRRLGIRGESKYHYVDLALDDSEPGLQLGEVSHNIGESDLQPDYHQASYPAHDYDHRLTPQLPAETACFPPQEHTVGVRSRPSQAGVSSRGLLFSDPNSPGTISVDPVSQMYDQYLRFPSTEESPFREESIALPDINRYVPPRTDPDIAHALTALYRTHCTSLIDCIRFCKEKQFFRLFTSFQGTLTVPVQKLFTHPDVAPWVRACDLLMYQKMVRVVSSLALQVVPPAILETLSNISANLGSHIRKTFHSQPIHVVEARLGPAVTFASLLHRLVRANRSAHAAANFLCSDDTRSIMWQDWVRIVNPKRVIEAELPNCGLAGYSEVYDILTRDVRQLLDPPNIPLWFENGTFCEASSSPQNTLGLNHNLSNTTEGILDRWCSLLTGLPKRFPKADTRTILQCINTISSGVMRELTITSADSFGAWWCIKVWLDEMSQWLTAMGGFLHQQQWSENVPPPVANIEGSHIVSGDCYHLRDDLNGYGQVRESFGDRQQPSGSIPGGTTVLRRPSTASKCCSFVPSFQKHALLASRQWFLFSLFETASKLGEARCVDYLADQLAAKLDNQPLVFSDSLRYLGTHDPNDDSGIGMGLSDEDLTTSKYGLTGAHLGADGIGGNVAVA